MPNEFIIRDGFLSKNVTVTGSLTVTLGITGSIVTASSAVTSSQTTFAATASVITSVISSSYSLQSVTSSYANGTYFVLTDVTTSLAFPRITRPTITAGLTSSMGGIISPFPGPFGWQTTATTAATVPAGTVYLTPIVIQSRITAQSIGVMVLGNTANNSGRFDVGLYSNISNRLLPGTIIASASISGSVITRTGSMYTASLSSPVTLTKDSIYWLGMVMSGSSGQNFYLTYSFTGVAWTGFPQNKMCNPLLGIHIPNNDATYRQVAYYTTTSTDATLPKTYSTNTASYTVLSYGTKVGSATNIPIPPSILF